MIRGIFQKRYFYLHNRLGSVKKIINTSGDVKNCYTYDPFGELFDTETEETVSNPFKFTSRYFYGTDKIGMINSGR